jgi:wyosine [tRNA(Phe)-imidazoG37] synthetase (radical SAM superfamily)
MNQFIFGPVPSRRLGISLGIDIIPYKTCTLDCIYCECGKTTNITTERQGFFNPEVILAQIQNYLEGNAPYIEYITLSGSGEPTLNKDIGVIIRGIKRITNIPIAVITNGTLLYKKEVRNDVGLSDLVLPSLDAISTPVFKNLNQPHKDLGLETIIEGLETFRKEFKRKIWLEVLIVKGVNDGKDELNGLYKQIKKIAPNKVQLNSIDRPPAYGEVSAVDIEVLENIQNSWKNLPVEIIKRIRKREEIASFNKNFESSLLNTINRRPLTIEDLEALTGKNRLEIFKYIDVLERERKIKPKIVDNKIFYGPF